MAYLLRLESDLWKWNHISLVPLFLQKRLKLLLYFWMFQNVNVNVNVSYIFSIDVSGLHFLICFIQNFWNKIIKSLYMMVVFLALLYPVICTHGYICIQDYLIIYLMFFLGNERYLKNNCAQRAIWRIEIDTQRYTTGKHNCKGWRYSKIHCYQIKSIINSNQCFFAFFFI